MKVFDKIKDLLPGIVIGVFLGLHYSGYLGAHMPLVAILTILVVFAKLAK